MRRHVRQVVEEADPQQQIGILGVLPADLLQELESLAAVERRAQPALAVGVQPAPEGQGAGFEEHAVEVLGISPQAPVAALDHLAHRVEEGVVVGVVVGIDQDLPPGVERAQERAHGVVRIPRLDLGEGGVGAVVVHVVEAVEPLAEPGAELLVVEDGIGPGGGRQRRETEEQSETEKSSGPESRQM